MDDFFDDFDDDMDGGFDDDGFENSGDDADGDETATESNDELWDGPDWQDWMIIGPISEDSAREKRDIDRIRREYDDTDDDYWERINRRW
ncbi:MAG: hypothetical protein HGJ94_09105 [Desulfosarcina sp.]|nr:hypothetical protein [Desulfosarcina sp.]